MSRLSTKDIEEGNPIALRFVKFQNVQNLQIFVKDNQTGSETTRIDRSCGCDWYTSFNYKYGRVQEGSGQKRRKSLTINSSNILNCKRMLY